MLLGGRAGYLVEQVEDGRGRTEERGQNSREEARRQRLEVSFCRRMGLIGRVGLPIDVDCGVGANRVQNHAKTNRISPLTAELGNVCQTWWLSESVASLVATELLGVTRSQGTSSQTLSRPTRQSTSPSRQGSSALHVPPDHSEQRLKFQVGR